MKAAPSEARGETPLAQDVARPHESAPGYYWPLLLAVFALTLAIRWSFLGTRWVNPDEGAHLMDAMLILQGLIPEVDYGTRQPFYVYGLAGTLELFGADLMAGRWFPLICSLASGLVIYLLGAELVDRRVGFVCAVIYLLLPLEIYQSVVVKTEAPVTLLITTSLWAAVAGRYRKRGVLLVASGVAAGLGFYVRETALLVPVVVLAFLLLTVRRERRELLKSFGLFCGGYLAVVAVALGLYAPHSEQGQLWDFTPIAFLTDALSQLISGVSNFGGEGDVIQAMGSWEGHGEPVSLYMAYLRDAVDFHLFLLVGLALAALILLRRNDAGLGHEDLRRDRTAIVLCYIWLGALGLMYVFRYLTRGFFIDYFREFLPPLVLLLAIWLYRAVPALQDDRNSARLVAVGVPAGVAWFLIQARFPQQIGLGHHTTLAVALLGAFVVAFSQESARRRWMFASLLAAIAVWIVVSRQVWQSVFSGVGPSVVTMLVLFVVMAGWYRMTGPALTAKLLRFGALSVVAATFALSLSYSALRLDMRYEAVWPVDEVTDIADVIARNSEPGAEVLSGAVIWEFLAGRRPYRLMTHPLGLLKEAPVTVRRQLAAALIERPPEIVVMDGYTKLTYGRNVPMLDSLVRRDYTLIASSNEGARPVFVFRRNTASGQGTKGN